MSNDWCFAIAREPGDKLGTATRGVLQTATKWSRAETITVAFLDGDDELRDSVKQIAREWIDDQVSVRFSFVKDPAQADVRVSFGDNGNWSRVGTRCRDVKEASQPTMSLSGFNRMDAPALRRAVLHEFGHALGFLHEHTHPKASIPWDRAAVYHSLSDRWTPQQIELNMFTTLPEDQLALTKFDRQSIMLYPIQRDWVTDPAYVTDWNLDLSQKDRELIRRIYRR